MANIDFFIPSTAWGGPTPRTAYPHLSPSAPVAWLPPFVTDADGVRQIAETLEPLIVALAVAGYRTTEIGVFDTSTMGLRLIGSTGLVEVDDPATWDSPPTVKGTGVGLRLDPVVLAQPPAGSVTLELSADMTSRVEGEWLFIDLSSAGDGPALRGGVHAAVLADVEAIRDAFGSATGTIGLEFVYDPFAWAYGFAHSDVVEAAAEITSFHVTEHQLTTDDALADLIGPEAADSDEAMLPELYPAQSLLDTVCDPAGVGTDVRAQAECRSLVTNLQATVRATTDTPDYATLPLTTVMFDLESRGLVDIFGPVGDIDEVEIMRILAIDPAMRLTDAEITTLADYLALGPAPIVGAGQSDDGASDATLSDDTATRLALEYRYLTDAQLDEVIVAFISLCRLAPPSQDGTDASGTFDRYVGELAGAMDRRVVAVPDSMVPADYYQYGLDETQRVWGQWQFEMLDPKMLAGAVRLFALAGDLELAADVVTTALDHYSIGLDQLSAHWRTATGEADVANAPDLVGWGSPMYEALCTAVWLLIDADILGATTRDYVADQLAAMYGTEPFTATMDEDVETLFGELLTDELDDAAAGTPDNTLLHVLTLMSLAGTDSDIGHRCNYAAISNLTARLFADENLAVDIAAMRETAAADALSPIAPDDLAVEMLAWITSDATQAYLATLDDLPRRLEEERLIAKLGKLSATSAEDAIAYCSGSAIATRLATRASQFDEIELGLEIEAASLTGAAETNFEVVRLGEGRQLAKVIAEDVKVGAEYLSHAGYWRFQSTFMSAARLHHAGKIDMDGLLAVHEVAVRSHDQVDAVAGRLGLLGNVVSVGVAVLAARELTVEGGWPPIDMNTTGLVDDVAGGLVAGVEIFGHLATQALVARESLVAANRWTSTLTTATKVFGALSGVVNMVTAGAAAYDSFQQGNYVEAGLYAVSAGAFGVSAAIIAFAPAGTLLFAAGPFIGFVAIAFGAAAALWGYWRLTVEAARLAEYESVLRDNELLFAPEVLLHRPFVDVSIEQELAASGDPIGLDTSFAIATIPDETGLDRPDEYADGVVYGRVILDAQNDDGMPPDEVLYDVSTLVPGDLLGYGDVRTGGPAPPPATDALATVRPKFEEWLTVDVWLSTVIDVHRYVGDWVEAGDPIITIEYGGGAYETVHTATYGGRLVALATRGQTFDLIDDEAGDQTAFRIRSEGRDLEIVVVAEP